MEQYFIGFSHFAEQLPLRLNPESVRQTSTLGVEKNNPVFRFHALSYAFWVFLLWWDKRWKPQGVSPLCFPPFAIPFP